MRLTPHIGCCIALMLLAGMTGCISTKIAAGNGLASTPRAFDGHLARLSLGFVAPPADADSRDLFRFMLAAKRAKLFKKADFAAADDTWPDLFVVNFHDNHPVLGTGFQCFEPYLLIISAGLVPAVCASEHAITFDIVTSSKTTIVHVEDRYLEKDAEGWFALALTPSESGRFNGTMKQYVRALFQLHADQIEGAASINRAGS